MRFPYYFRIGHELEGGEIMTAWLGEVRAATNAAARRLGHPVKLGVARAGAAGFRPQHGAGRCTLGARGVG